jgi:nitrilase
VPPHSFGRGSRPGACYLARMSKLRVAVAQMAPIWLDRDATLAKVAVWSTRAAEAGADVVVFGEALAPGYPFWLEHTGGARFEDRRQQELFAHYLDQGVEPRHLAPLCDLAAARRITIVIGIVERALDRGGHSLYCAMATITPDGLRPPHRKLVPTHEERLVWAPGDGHGLVCHQVGEFTVGGLLCWENWMPLPRAALQAEGENVHLALWPGNERNTADTTRFLAREGRSFVVAASGLLRSDDLTAATPFGDQLRSALPPIPANGGSCVAGPDGHWLLPPIVGEERLAVVDLDHAAVRRERQNFDPAGHYCRPDVLRLELDRTRQATLRERRL